MGSNDFPLHEHILEMSELMSQCTALNPPVLETYTSAYSLIERRQFTNMIELASHVLLLAQMQTSDELAGQAQKVLESWILRGEPMPNQFIYETAELFASVGYRFRVVQWTTREQAFDQLVSAAGRKTLEDETDPLDPFLSGSRIQQGYTSFTPWAMNSYEGQYHHDSHVPSRQQCYLSSVYKTDPKPDLDCVVCPSCNFCTKVRIDMLKHEAQHWEPQPCSCARSNQKAMAAQLDIKRCQCGRFTTDENARMLRNWADEETGQLLQRFGNLETMPTFTSTTAIQMQRDMTDRNMEQYL